MRRVAITVDVEAHLHRSDRNHVDRLIWGRQNGREAGIQTMMDIAGNDAPLTFFVDYPEYEIHGEAILDVAREIRRRGHDPEPHCHPEYLCKKLFDTEDPEAVRIGNATNNQAARLADYLLDRHMRAIGSPPLAHRSRGYELSPAYLEALSRAGFHLDASYSLSCKRDPLRLGLRGPFRFTSGLLEIPVPFVPYFKNAGPLIPWNFNQRCFLTPDIEENLLRHTQFLESWFARHGDGAIATLVMHSWSFWRMDAKGFFTIPDDAGIELFKRLLAFLKANYEVVSLATLAGKNEEPARHEEERVDASFPVAHCPVCYEPASHFQDYNGAPKRLCPFCHSVERHRTLVDLVYQGAFGPRVFHGKDVLHIAPGRPETLLLRRMYNCRVTTLNILPGCDVQADLQAMPELEDNAFDVVLASEVFRHVRHLDRALAEIVRVLRPGGLLLCSDCLDNADNGREITDPAEQIAWYGQEKLDTYGIGDFRRFGRTDWETAFTPWFFTRLFKAEDKATGSPAWWLACVPRPAGGAHQTDPVMTEALLRSNAGRILLDAAHDPLQTFLPDFRGWEDYRQTYAASDLTWLKKNIFTLHFKPLDALPCTGDVADFPARYLTTDVHPYRFQSFAHLLPELAQDSAHGTCPRLHHLISEITRWIDTYGFSAQSLRTDRHTCWMVWDDSATALRLNFMAYAFLRMLPLPDYPSRLLEKIFRSLLDHFLLLCTESFFSAHNNHGWLQMFGLLSFCRAMPRLRGATAATGIATERILRLAEQLLTPDGMLREHSPAYQAFCITLFATIRDTLSSSGHGASPDVTALDALLKKMRFCLRCVTKSDGELAAFGDTPIKAYDLIAPEVQRAATAGNTPAGIAILPRSGCATLRDGASFLSLSGAFYSYTHKHCDDLSFIWSEGSRNILVDSGEQTIDRNILHSGPLWEKGFYCSTPNCVYAESAHAHNVVEINGQTWSRRLPPWGALPLSGQRLSETHWLLQGSWQRPEGFLQQRRLILSPGRWLLVLDDLEPPSDTPPEPAAFTQWFHCDPLLELEDRRDGMAVFRLPDGDMLHCQTLAPQTVLTYHKGEVAPRLQGWVAQTSRSLTPAWALGLHQEKTSASFCTLFSLIGPCRERETVGCGCLLRFAHGVTERVLWSTADRAETPPGILP